MHFVEFLHGIRLVAELVLLEISNPSRMVLMKNDCVLFMAQSTIFDGEVFGVF